MLGRSLALPGGASWPCIGPGLDEMGPGPSDLQAGFLPRSIPPEVLEPVRRQGCVAALIIDRPRSVPLLPPDLPKSPRRCDRAGLMKKLQPPPYPRAAAGAWNPGHIVAKGIRAWPGTMVWRPGRSEASTVRFGRDRSRRRSRPVAEWYDGQVEGRLVEALFRRGESDPMAM
jgi:hypothetical protein